MDYYPSMSRPQRITLVLALGWSIGLIVQLVIGLSTGYADIFPPQMLLGLALCLGAGARERRMRPMQNWRSGARAGATMMLFLIGPYLILTALILTPSADMGGETWLSLLLEAPLWIGMTFGSGALLGVIGWRIGVL
jgi:hypothetical protein